MNSYETSIFDCIANNKFPEARRWLKRYADHRVASVKSNAGYFQRICNTIDKNSTFLEALPTNISDKLVVEDPSLSLILKRYVPCEEDEEVLTKLENTYHVGQRLNDLAIRYVNGAIFYGASGCGKTALGRYLAARLHLPFAYLDFSGAINSYLGKTAENIRLVFNYIKGRPCVFMIDEVDAIGGMRHGGSGVDGEMNRVVITLMQNLDTFESESILLFATNRLDILDPALLRRIPIHYEMRPMDKIRRLNMIKAYLDTIPGAEYNDSGIYNYLKTFKDNESNAIIINELIQWIVGQLAEGKPIQMCSDRENQLSLFEEGDVL